MAQVGGKAIICFVCLVFLSWMAFVASNRALNQAKEAALQQALSQMRAAIAQYKHNKNKYPQCLDDLVTAGYLKAIPKDPFTNRADTWDTREEDVLTPIAENPLGVTDVERSTLTSADSDGKAYSSW